MSLSEVIEGYVNEHPPESLARLTSGRELGWPYCNPDGGHDPWGRRKSAQING